VTWRGGARIRLCTRAPAGLILLERCNRLLLNVFPRVMLLPVSSDSEGCAQRIKGCLQLGHRFVCYRALQVFGRAAFSQHILWRGKGGDARHGASYTSCKRRSYARLHSLALCATTPRSSFSKQAHSVERPRTRPRTRASFVGVGDDALDHAPASFEGEVGCCCIRVRISGY
jgi:hypothetical protein